MGPRFSRWSVFAIALAAAGCSSVIRSHDVTPLGLARGDDQVRRMLSRGSADSAMIRFAAKNSPAPTDDLLRALYKGVVAYYAGQHDSSAFLLDQAGLLLEDREFSLRISREAAALVSNDRAKPFAPSRTEKLLIPYYGALSYLRMGNPLEAAVEARRLSHALESLGDEPKGAEKQVRGFLRYFAGAVFEAAGQHNDAAVAYRNAQQLLGDSVAVSAPPADSGDVIVVFEDGFVAHRYEESLTIVIANDEADGLRDDDRHRRDRTAHDVAARAFAHALRPALEYQEGPRLPRHSWHIPAPPRERRERRTECTDENRDSNREQNSSPKSGTKSASDSTASIAKTAPNKQTTEEKAAARDECKDDDDDFYILRMAWPSYHTMRRPLRSAQLVIDSVRHDLPLFLNVSDGVVSDFDRERGEVLARMVVRAAAKAVLTKSAEKSVSKKNEDLGWLVGAIANVSGAVLEQADTRSWTLLPGGISMARIRLPVGTRALSIDLGGSYAGRRIDLGPLQVQGGALTFVTARNW